MRKEQEIRSKIHAIVTDDRFRAAPADMTINAPLAIVQSGLRSEIKALCFVLDYSSDFKQGEQGAYEHVRRYGLDEAKAMAGRLIMAKDEYSKGFKAVIEDYIHAIEDRNHAT